MPEVLLRTRRRAARPQGGRRRWAAGGLGALAAAVALAALGGALLGGAIFGGTVLGGIPLGGAGEPAATRVAAAVDAEVSAVAADGREALLPGLSPAVAVASLLDPEPAQLELAAVASAPPRDLEAAAPPPPESAPQLRRYVVEPGDSLLAIAIAFDVDLAALQAANGLGVADLIIVGQELLVPPAAPPAPGA